MRHSATRSLLERDDVLIVASVSCIYGIGSVESYSSMKFKIRVGEEIDLSNLKKKLVELQYKRNDQIHTRGTFRNLGDFMEIFPAHLDNKSWRISFFGDTIEEITEIISEKYSIHPIKKNYSSEVADRYQFDDGEGELGFISSVSNPFCMSCTRSRITADGKFVTCLFSNKGLDLKRYLRSKATDEDILNLISDNWLVRDDQYSLDRSLGKGKVKDKIEMFQLGG